MRGTDGLELRSPGQPAALANGVRDSMWYSLQSPYAFSTNNWRDQPLAAILCVEVRHADIPPGTSDIDNRRPVMPLTEQQKQARAEKRRMMNALKEEARAHRDEARRIEWREKGMHLTREQAAAGEPCRGCGLPVIDNLGDWGGTMYLTPEQRSDYDAEQAKYRKMHPNCDAHRWSMQGSRATHCGYCCPPLPMSREQSEHIGRLLASFPERREEELDIWERILTCGHKVEQSVHHTNQSPSFSTARCPGCEMTRGVVNSVKIVEAAARMAEVMRKRDDRVARAERELKKAEKAVAEAREKLAEAHVNS
ncbi:hypothetical protein [Lacisediminihabitans changchengi]|uniref:Uncharacterized protein n=1 Tax=Lacisediminihabitans changchengi TaxID=2787634 RepID=A0A934VY62_9MICO|nr:hypothetical protein [Lacisediminihabitans changchengi]MBK4347672.1 hypothetical protein [Lacisediminihabitans changchengi]